MKKLCCLPVLICLLFFSACSVEPKTTAEFTTLATGIGDSSYDTVSQVKDLKCDISFHERCFTIEDEKAKALNKLISENISRNQTAVSSPDAESIFLRFYSGEKIDSSSSVTPLRSGIEYGTYMVMSDNKVGFSAAPYVSAIFYYESSRTLFEQVCTLAGVEMD